jgi:hypothetical protein
MVISGQLTPTLPPPRETAASGVLLGVVLLLLLEAALLLFRAQRVLLVVQTKAGQAAACTAALHARSAIAATTPLLGRKVSAAGSTREGAQCRAPCTPLQT